jgi:hypothetical protein
MYSRKDGLASRSGYAANWPEIIRACAGHTLWALMVFLTLGFLFTRTRTIHLATAAMLIATSVECSQLITHPAIEIPQHFTPVKVGKLE